MRSAIIHSLSHLAAFLKNEAKHEKTLVKILDILSERVHDVSTFGRSAALSAWGFIIEQRALPLSYIHTVTDLAIERVNDKSAIVRKQALALLTALVECNPYNGELTQEFYVAKVAEVQSWIVQNDMGKDAEEEEEQEQQDEEPSEMKKQLLGKMEFLKYCKSALLFIARIERACAELAPLLSSKTTTDVLMSLRFFVVAKEFKLSSAHVGICRMLSLVWDSRESGQVRKELLESFERLYVARTVNGKRIAFAPTQIAGGLIELTLSASLDQLTSLEEVVADCMRGEDSCLKRRVLPSSVIECLYDAAEQERSKGKQLIHLCY